MAFDVGDPVPLAVAVTDSSGAAANATLVTCTVTLPDGVTTVNVTVTNPSTGTYVGAYIATVPGRHTVRWVATGLNACTYSDVFEVAAADPGMLISLAQARSALRLPGSVSASQRIDDEDLRELIMAATGPMEDLCGPILPRQCDETHDGGGVTVRLLQAPCISITNVVESYGAGYNRTLTLETLDGNGAFDSFGYTVDLDDGILMRRISGVAAQFIGGRRNIHVTYVAGRTVISMRLVRATRRLVRWLWQTEMQGQRPTNSGPEQVTYTPMGFAVPNAVVQLCGDERRIQGVA
ncbi:hypothetical protein ACSMXN_09275 [Jatrophihabitans sp. DSM 45814]